MKWVKATDELKPANEHYPETGGLLNAKTSTMNAMVYYDPEEGWFWWNDEPIHPTDLDQLFWLDTSTIQQEGEVKEGFWQKKGNELRELIMGQPPSRIKGEEEKEFKLSASNGEWHPNKVENLSDCEIAKLLQAKEEEIKRMKLEMEDMDAEIQEYKSRR